MSKKQQTLYQSWSSGSKSSTFAAKKIMNGDDDVVVLDSDDDELMREALEESLKDLPTTVLPQQNSAANSYISVQPLAATPVETLPGFDNEAGKTWIYPTNYPVRKYQRDIVTACLFENTLVALPTGLGKSVLINSILAVCPKTRTQSCLGFLTNLVDYLANPN